MTPEEMASKRDSFAKFNVEKDFSGFPLEETFFHTLENTIKLCQVFVQFQDSFLSPTSFIFHQISKSGGPFHHLTILLSIISMLGEQTFHIFSINAIYLQLPRL